ncbi:MAG: hypothetical protein QG604_986 [Candidatus Dependentiae bacterium]|nr:hypothetical protein [Candidatus Dependentiae bacterium]
MRNIQKNVKAFCDNNHLVAPAPIWLMDAISELSEVSKECSRDNEKLIIELGDALFSLIGLANSLDVDLQAALAAALMQYSEQNERENEIAREAVEE